MTEPWLSVLGGGLVAALVTILYNSVLENRRQRAAEDWEYRRYQANLIHGSLFGLLEVFFSAKSELLFLVDSLESSEGELRALEANADEVLRNVNPQLPATELERVKEQQLGPYIQYHRQKTDARWQQYATKAAEFQARAEAHLAALRPLIPADLYARCEALYQRLSESYTWDVPNARERLQLFSAAYPELQGIHASLAREVEIALGRRNRDSAVV